MHEKARSRMWVSVAILTVVVVVAVAALRGNVHTSQRRVGIIGGVPVASSTLPALTYLHVQWGHTVVQCTGTLVAPNAVLTAAHCVENSHTGEVAGAAQVRVLVGRLSSASARHPRSTVTRIVVFGGPRYPTESADVALLVMSTLTTPSPIPLAPGDSWSGAPRADMVGWSASNLLPRAFLDAHFSHPEKVIAPTVAQTSGWCEAKVWNFDARYDLCAIDPPSYSTGGCVGASGAPLVASNMSPIVEIGMVIKGPAGCSPRRPTVFIRIGAIRRWITAQLAATDTQGGKEIGAARS
jgi:secreted trypsin-like serine protease